MLSKCTRVQQMMGFMSGLVLSFSSAPQRENPPAQALDFRTCKRRPSYIVGEIAPFKTRRKLSCPGKCRDRPESQDPSRPCNCSQASYTAGP